MNQPLVTIVMLSYNHEKYILEGLRSVAEQSYRRIEFIVIDDCSSDGSVTIIEDFFNENKDKFEHAVFIKNEKNVGITKNLNRGLELANGEIVKSLASDDFLDKDCIRTAVNYMAEHETCDVLLTNGYEFYDFDVKHKSRFYKSKYIIKDNMFEEIFKCNDILAPGVFLRASVFQDCGHYDEKASFEDWEFWLRILYRGKKFEYLNKCTVYYRNHGESLSRLKKSPTVRRRFDIMYRGSRYTIRKYKRFVTEEVYNEKLKSVNSLAFLDAMHYGLDDYVKYLRKRVPRDNKRIELEYILYQMKCLDLFLFLEGKLKDN